MLLKTVKITAVPNAPLAIVTFENNQPKLERLITLVEFSAKPGQVRWEFRDDQNRIFEGGLGTTCDLTYYRGAFIALSIPVTLHKRTGSPSAFGVDFIFKIPHAKQVQSLSYLKEKFPELNLSVL